MEPYTGFFITLLLIFIILVGKKSHCCLLYMGCLLFYYCKKQYWEGIRRSITCAWCLLGSKSGWVDTITNFCSCRLQRPWFTFISSSLPRSKVKRLYFLLLMAKGHKRQGCFTIDIHLHKHLLNACFRNYLLS